MVNDKNVCLDVPLPKKDRFPGIVIIIMLTEFCERFSFSGMRAFLTLYLRSKLGYSDDGATEMYHVFSTFVYVFPIIGGIVADNYLGKFRTILYMMFIYAAGNLLVAVTAIPQLHLPGRLCTMIGLLMITVGTGGIKPCVTSFGGDQFSSHQEHQLAIYFSALYFTLCVGSLIAKTVSPILRSDVHCFGDKDCYSLAFGAPGIVVLLSIVIFVSAKNKYHMKKPEANIVVDFVKCVCLGLKNLIFKRKKEKASHWLDTTHPRYDKTFIKDVKRSLSILTLFTTVPVFWALLDQMGSRWTLQATKMDGRLGLMTIKPDQLQVFAPICILLFIPITQKFLYPFFERRNILRSPLHKMILGACLAGVAFVASGLVEIYLKTTYPELPEPGFGQLRVFNGNPCSVAIYNDHENIVYTIPSLSHYVKKDIRVNEMANITLGIGGTCIEPRDEILVLEENAAISFFITGNTVHRFKDNLDKSKSGLPVVRFLISERLNDTVTFYNEDMKDVEAALHSAVSRQMDVYASKYSVLCGGVIKSGISMDSGGVYTVMVDKADGDHIEASASVIVLTEPNSITMALLLPQYLIISIAEVLYAVTGNEFTFKEAPDSMRAVMTAVWLMTEALGNVLIIIITRLCVNCRQETQSFIYTALMYSSLVVFWYLSRGYQFAREERKRQNSEVLYLQVKQAEDCLDH
ncbi:peptide transporter family 1-like [Aricia agestis]|uniref:peptide transporter family 1-like n=1 Tax=Aricia agestis TaxID=91739 RepID=UPI001C20A735|nr:peptide transporter family 1-like [Aricia agestis]